MGKPYEPESKVDISGAAHNADAQVHEMLWRKASARVQYGGLNHENRV